MELVDLSRVRKKSDHFRAQRTRRRRSLRGKSAYHEPLLGDGTYVPSEEPPRVDRPSRLLHSSLSLSSIAVAGREVVPPTGVQTYQPPRPLGGPYHPDGVDEGNPSLLTPEYARVPELYFSVPKPPSFSRAILRQTPARTTSASLLPSSLTVTQQNPIEDLAGVFSYGFFCVQCVRTQEVGIIEDMGRFHELLEPGVYFMLWPCSDISGRLSLRVQQLDVICETKTRDNVFVQVSVAVQFRVIVEKAYDAYYRLTDPRTQIKAYVFDIVRSTVPRLTIDSVFESKSDIAKAALGRLYAVMHDYGYEILEALVVDISPDPLVKASMNEINASKRLKEAMPHRAEADKARKVIAAEAAAESSYLLGVGVANERKAIARGLKDSISQFSDTVAVTPSDAMNLLLLSQYFDTISAIGGNSMLLLHEPAQVFDMQKQVRTPGPL